MRYLSVAAGIEAASVAWHPLGFEPVAFSEIDAFPSAVLAHHYPTVPNYGDMTRYKEWPDADIAILVGGTPCQSYSVAGQRGGIDDPRGALVCVYLAIARRYRPTWVVWENVPGVLSSHGGRDFGTFLGALAECGYGFAYRVLDAQFFGVPQRRRRVFVVGYLGGWRGAAAVLFESTSLRGDSPPSREAGERIAPSLEGRAGRSGETDFHTSGGLVAATLTGGGNTERSHGKRSGSDRDTLVTHSLRADGFDASEDGTGRGTPIVAKALTSSTQRYDSETFNARQDPVQHTTVDTDGYTNAVLSLDVNKSGNEGSSQGIQVEHSNALRTDKMPAVLNRMAVRRITPEEAEALQGFPRGYTLIDYRGKPAADGPRYKAIGNSMAIPVMRWIGERIKRVQELA